MSEQPFWYDEPQAWDTVYISVNGTQTYLPGIVAEDGVRVKKAAKLDKKTGPGINAATITYQGAEVATVDIAMRCWTPTHLHRLVKFLQDISPTQAKPARPRDFYHPVLALHGLRSLIVENVEGPGMPDAQGIVHYTLSCCEYAPPPKSAPASTSTPNASDALNGIALPTFAPGDLKLPAAPTPPTGPGSSTPKP